MKLFEVFSETGYHSSVITSFCIDFAAYEDLVLTRLREAGCKNNIVIADARLITQALGEGARAPRHAGQRYSVVGARTQALFHPKLILQLGDDRARLLVASANLTSAGLAGNLEVIGQVRWMRDAQEAPSPVFRQALEYMRGFVDPLNATVVQQLDWAVSQSRWLLETGEERDDLHLLLSGESQGLSQRFVAQIGSSPVEQLLVVSPYWDHDREAFKALQRALSPRRSAILLQPETGLYPHDARDRSVTLYDLKHLVKARRFSHAKLVIARTRQADHVLFGSANCTGPALGRKGSVGSNAEACLYRRMPPGEALRALGLEAILRTAPVERVADYVPEPRIPLSKLQQLAPGSFTLAYRTLTWQPSQTFDLPDATVELLDASGAVIASGLQLPRVGAVRSITIGARMLPSLARVQAAGTVSGPAIVLVRDTVLEQMKVEKTRKIQDALAMLDMDSDAGTWMMDVLDDIDAEERRLLLGGRRSGRRRVTGTKVLSPVTRALSHDEFMDSDEGDTAPDWMPPMSIGMSHVNSLRAALNRLLGIHEVQAETPAEPAPVPLDLGDEVPEGEDAVEGGLEFPDEQPETVLTDERQGALVNVATGEEASRLRARNDKARDIEKCVRKFVVKYDEDVSHADLGMRDLLRLRVALTVLVAAAARGIVRSSGEDGWPRLTSQLLFVFFRSSERSLIHSVRFTPDDDGGVPRDMLETLATALWTVTALALAKPNGKHTDMFDQAHSRAKQMYVASGLAPEYFRGDVMARVFDGMNTRYATALGLDAQVAKDWYLARAAESPRLREAVLRSL